MKKIYLLLTPILFCLQLNGYAIVFIHLGSEIPDHLFDAVRQARLFNEHADIIVIAEQNAVNDVNASVNDCRFVLCESLLVSDAHKKFRRETSLNKKAREGLWCKSTERFFYLEELIRQQELSDVFHLEYDNMLYVDLGELLSAFRKYPGIAVTLDSDQRCIAGFMYIAKIDVLKKMIHFIANKASRGFIDTRVLALFQQENAQDVIDHLPIIVPGYVQQYGLCNKLGHKTKKPLSYMQYIELFDSIFDAAAIGQYLGGLTPCHAKSQAGFVNETCLFNASKLTYSWHKDAQGRKVPYASCGDRIYRVNNLHIHSKNLKAFAS